MTQTTGVHRLRLAVLVALAAFALPGQTSTKAAEGALETDSRSPYVHRISLYDKESMVLDIANDPAEPYSPSGTCGKCHPYESIGGGWHFNAAKPNVDSGRPGAPWILTDLKTGTQLPVSARGWKGTWKPEDAGLSAWSFVKTFGRQMPGGGLGESEAESLPDPAARWDISGFLEIDCLACHSADMVHDQAERDRQIQDENFKYVPTAALGLGSIRGAAKNAPDDWDPLMPPDLDHPEAAGPALVYDLNRFDTDNRVLFNVTDSISPERCYFCHTEKIIGHGDAIGEDTDIHIARGLKCVDCHRNAIDHAIVRGYEGEPRDAGNVAAGTLTCRGCHYGVDPAGDGQARGGRLASPFPEHPGLPPVHFDKLSCTACHSGPWPEAKVGGVMTAMAHGLGLAERGRREDAPPFIEAPVFLTDANGKLAPHRLVWPAFWGRLDEEGNIKPITPEEVAKKARKTLGSKNVKPEDWKPLSDETITAVLEALADDNEGRAVYIVGGKMLQLDDSGALQAEDNDAAKPYAWPIAHDVRPARQALGVAGCTDCHAKDSPIHYAKITPMGPAERTTSETLVVYEMQGKDPVQLSLWAASFAMRPAFKIVLMATIGLIALALLFGALTALMALGRGGRHHGK